MNAAAPHELRDFASRNRLTGLTLSTLAAMRAERDGYTVARGRQFLLLQRRLDEELLQHRSSRTTPVTHISHIKEF